MLKRERLTERLAAAKTERKTPSSTSGGGSRRNLDGFVYDISKAKILKRSLHNINVSLGTLISTLKEVTMLRGSEITPDGMLGGRGFIMSFKDMKGHITDAVRNLSDVTDTISDELTNPKWGLSNEEVKKVKKEKEDVEDKVEIMEETVDQLPPEDAEDTETKTKPEPKPDPELDRNRDEDKPKEDAPVLDGISPDDVRDSSEIESLKRYKEMLEGHGSDKTANALSKNILANLLKGDR